MIRTYKKQCNRYELDAEVYHLANDLKFDILKIVCYPQGFKEDPVYEVEVDTDGYVGVAPVIPAVLCASTCSA